MIAPYIYSSRKTNHRRIYATDNEENADVDISNDEDSTVPLQRPEMRKYMFLLSLKWSDLENSNENQTFSKTVYDTWKWKDEVLGDGRDYFLPKSKTLRALQQYIILQQQQLYSSITSSDTNLTSIRNNHTVVDEAPYSISECVILSNCARFEILLVVDASANPLQAEDSNTNKSYVNEPQHQLMFHQQLQERVVSDVSILLYAQVLSYQRNSNNNFLAATTSFLDRPNVIDTNAMVQLRETMGDNSNSSIREFTQHVQQIQQHWNVLNNVHAIISHLCAITVGIAPRPRRPDRMVLFRPFSSRDAHILLQFKRTTDIASTSITQTKATSVNHNTNNSNKSNKHSNRILLLLQYAIRAGKAARNPQKVPLLNTLRQQYGETGNSNKYDIVPPTHVMDEVVQSVHELVIYPIIQECVHHFDTMLESSATTKYQIQSLRCSALAMATTHEERQYILSQLHGPTIYLRQRQRRLPSVSGDDNDGNNNHNQYENDSDMERLPQDGMRVVWNETQFLEELNLNLTKMRKPHQEKVTITP
jgi:hypothetical protein